MSQTAKIILTIILTALIVSGGTYYFTSQASQSDKADLESKIDELETKVEQQSQTKEDTEQSTEPEGYELETYSDSGEGLSFQYPASWGEVNKELITPTSEEVDRGKAKEKRYNFASFPGDKDFSNYNYFSLFNLSDYQNANDSTPQAYSYLESVYSRQSVEGLTAPEREANLFGQNLAKKSDMTYISSENDNIRGVYFFMRDGNGYGVNLSLNVALLNEEGEPAGLNLYMWSEKQKELEQELDQIQKTNNTSELQAWDQKMDDFMNNEAQDTFSTQLEQIRTLVNFLSY